MTLQEQCDQQAEQFRFHSEAAETYTKAAETYTKNIRRLINSERAVKWYEELESGKILLSQIAYFANTLYKGFANPRLATDKEVPLISSHLTGLKASSRFKPVELQTIITTELQTEIAKAQIKTEAMPDSPAKKIVQIIVSHLGSDDIGKLREAIVTPENDTFFKDLKENGLPTHYLQSPEPQEEELTLKERIERRSVKHTEDGETLERMRTAISAKNYYQALLFVNARNHDLLASTAASRLFLAFAQNVPMKENGHLGGEGEIDPRFIDQGLKRTQSVQNSEVKQAIVTILETLKAANEILNVQDKERFIRETLIESGIGTVIEKVASGQIRVPGEEEPISQRLGGSNHQRISVDFLGGNSRIEKHHRSASMRPGNFGL